MYEKLNEKYLTFAGKLISDYSEDKERNFAITYYLTDSSLAINEGKSKSSPNPARFLAKSIIKDPITKYPYKNSNFFIGSKIHAAGRLFELIDAPEYTLSYMEAFPDQFPFSEMDYAIQNLKKISIEKNIDIKEKFISADPFSKGTLSFEKSKEILYELSPNYPKQASLTLLRRFTDQNEFQYEIAFNYANL